MHREHPGQTLANALDPGSSPFTRGLWQFTLSHGNTLGLTPARAGNIGLPCLWRAGRPVYPRSRGEHLTSGTGFRSGFGSSPLTQGTRSPPRPRKRRRRLIPARAGNMTGEQWSSVTMSAHPRSRGEHTGEDRCYPCWQGSSPLARGTCRGCSGPPALKRLIPARAGNMAPTGRHSRQATAHPRSRGEHSVSSLGGGVLVGSSPLARGTFGTGRALNVRVRLIPARAGNITLC